MRKKIIIATTAGVLSLTGLGLAVPALAADEGTGATASSAVERITEALSGLVTGGSITQEQADEVAATLSDAGIGRGGPHGHGRGMDLGAAATALGMTGDELRTALEPDGTTLAQVAEDQGVAVDDLVAALVQAADERITSAVEDGRLTQAEADERLADVEERIAERVTSDAPVRGGHHGPRGHGDGGAPGGIEPAE